MDILEESYDLHGVNFNSLPLWSPMLLHHHIDLFKNLEKYHIYPEYFNVSIVLGGFVDFQN